MPLTGAMSWALGAVRRGVCSSRSQARSKLWDAKYRLCCLVWYPRSGLLFSSNRSTNQ